MDIIIIFIVLLLFLVVPPLVTFLVCTIEEALWDIRDERKIAKARRERNIYYE